MDESERHKMGKPRKKLEPLPTGPLGEGILAEKRRNEALPGDKLTPEEKAEQTKLRTKIKTKKQDGKERENL